MKRTSPCRLAAAATPILALALLAAPTAGAAGTHLVHAADGARVDTERGAVELPRRDGLVFSTVVPLAAEGARTGADPAWVAAGVETVELTPEPTAGGPLFEAETVRRVALYEVRPASGGDAAAGGGAEVRRVAAPEIAAPALRSPSPLAAGGVVDGLAWLEGANDRSLAVRFAPRGGDAWGAAETVAAAGPGSQLALAAVRLADASPLLAWSRFDGEDDEIYWSVRRDGAWSEPRRLGADDSTPDVTPALVAVDGGALAAWASYEDDRYRILVSRFDGESWGGPVVLPGLGTFPSFEAAAMEAGAPAVLYRTATGWRVAEVGADGRPGRHADVLVAGRLRPVVSALDGGGPTLAWPAVGDGAAVERTLGWGGQAAETRIPVDAGAEGGR